MGIRSNGKGIKKSTGVFQALFITFKESASSVF